MYTFTFIAHPKPSHQLYGEVAGAYANVFVNDVVAKSAEAAARSLIEEAGWDIEKLDDWAPMSPGDDAPGTEGAEYYAQAREDGICAVFHTWPVGEPH